MLKYLFYPERFMLLNITAMFSLLNIVIGVIMGWGITLMCSGRKSFARTWGILFVVWIILQIVSMLGFSGTVSLWISISSLLFSHLPKFTIALVSSIVIWLVGSNKKE